MGDDTPPTTPTGRERSNANLAPPWKPGQSGNPKGRPKGARSILQEDFFKALQSDFEKHGIDAIIAMRGDDPGQYAKMIASLMTKEMDVSADVEQNVRGAFTWKPPQ